MLVEPERAQHYHVYGKKIIVVDGRLTTSQERAMTSPRTSRLGGTPPMNESSASGQAPEEEGPETGEDREAQLELCKWTGSRGGGTWQTGAKVSAQARPSQWDSIRLV